jgi:predicted peptidase
MNGTDPSQIDNLPKASGVYKLNLQPGGRRITISVPEGYSDKQATPLIIALHWGGPMRPFKGHSILTKLVKPALDELEAIIVAPDCNAESWDNTQSETEILELIYGLKKHYKIDDKKRLLMGYSRGGKGTWFIGARNQKDFAAALIMSASPLRDTTDFTWNMPLYIIHSRDDEEFPYEEVEATVRDLQAQGALVELATVEGITHLETHRFVEPLRMALPWIQSAWKGRETKS